MGVRDLDDLFVSSRVGQSEGIGLGVFLAVVGAFEGLGLLGEVGLHGLGGMDRKLFKELGFIEMQLGSGYVLGIEKE